MASIFNNPNFNSSNKISLTPEECDKIAQRLAFTKDKYRENILMPKVLGQQVLKTKEEYMVETAVESCAFKSLMSCVIGSYNLN